MESVRHRRRLGSYSAAADPRQRLHRRPRLARPACARPPTRSRPPPATGALVALVASAEAAAPLEARPPAATLERLRAIKPRPHLADRGAHLPSIGTFLEKTPGASIVWITEGVRGAGDADFAKSLAELAAKQGSAVTLLKADRPPALARRRAAAAGREAHRTVLRAAPNGRDTGLVRALDPKGLPLAESRFTLEPEARETTVTSICRWNCATPSPAWRSRARARPGRGADGRARPAPPRRPRLRRHPRSGPAAARPDLQPGEGPLALRRRTAAPRRAGHVGGHRADARQSGLGAGARRCRRARRAHARPRRAIRGRRRAAAALRRSAARRRQRSARAGAPAPRRAVAGRHALLGPAEDAGGVCPREPLRRTRAAADIGIRRQILAEPDGDLPGKTWAALQDGTPIVTAQKRGQGLVVLFHVTADTTWSNLPLSGCSSTCCAGSSASPAPPPSSPR